MVEFQGQSSHSDYVWGSSCSVQHSDLKYKNICTNQSCDSRPFLHPHLFFCYLRVLFCISSKPSSSGRGTLTQVCVCAWYWTLFLYIFTNLHMLAIWTHIFHDSYYENMYPYIHVYVFICVCAPYVMFVLVVSFSLFALISSFLRSANVITFLYVACMLL